MFVLSSQQELLFLGNFIVPLHNPFEIVDSDAIVKKDGVIFIGPGLEMRINHVMHVNVDGIITHFEFQNTDASQQLLKRAKQEAVVNNTVSSRIYFTHLSEFEFLSPGFIDCHIHAPQYAFAGTATDKPLMGRNGWLQSYTFPTEHSMVEDYEQQHPTARDIYQRVVRRTVRCGTTTAMYFGTLHLEPNKILCKVISDVGQRGLVGKVCMDCNDVDSEYRHSIEQNVLDTVKFIEYVRSLPASKEGLLLPVITPRFIPSCSPGLLQELGNLAKSYNCHIQSHISESMDEVNFVTENNNGITDTRIFDRHGLLTSKSIMAHGNWLNEDDIKILRDRKSAIAHCPLSNFFFAGKPLRTRRLMEQMVKIGLGTDVAAGYSPSMIDAARNAVVMSRALTLLYDDTSQDECSNVCHTNKDADTLDYRHAYYLATLGGAEALGLKDTVGTFQVGKVFDAVILSANPLLHNIDIFLRDSKEDIFQKLCNLGDDRNILKVFVKGREIKHSMSND